MKFFANGNSNCCLKCDREINSFINIIYFLYIFSYIHVEGKIAHLKVLKCFLSHCKIFQHYYVRCLVLLYKCFSGIHVERISCLISIEHRKYQSGNAGAIVLWLISLAAKLHIVRKRIETYFNFFIFRSLKN